MNWKKRQQQLNKQLEKDEEKLKKRLSSYFDAEYRKLEKQIASYYQQYGEDNVIQYRRMMESLPDADKRLLLEQMDEFAKKYPEYAYLMPIRESIYKLNRLEGLQYSIRMQQLEIGAIENEQISEHLNRQAMRGANAAAETMGFGKNFYANNPDITKSFVNVAWSDGENFSQKIWNNTSKLANYLNTDIAQGFARGDPYERLTRKLRERFGKVSRNDAYRLIYTEGTYVMAEATMQPFKEDFEQYRLSTAADGKVCSICRGIAQEVFNISDRQPEINFPPLHPWCRCSFTIEVNDWDTWMEEYEKRYRNGQAEKVAERMDDEQQQRIRARRAAYKNRQNRSKSVTNQDIKDFSKMNRDELIQWVNDNLRTAINDIKGTDTEYLRDAVKVLSEFEQKMGGRTIPGLNIKFGGVSKNAYAEYNSKTNTLHLKKTGSKERFEKKQKEENFRYRFKWKKDKDYHATETFSGTIWHELGHAVDVDTGQRLSKLLSKSSELNELSVRISAYAGTTGGIGSPKRSEAWAENFAAYMEGGKNKGKVPKEISGLIEDYFSKSVEKSNSSDIMKSGAKRGALTDKNDPLYEKRDRHAETYYESVRNSKKAPIVKVISQNSGFSEAYISKVYDHVFVNEYDLYGGRKRFEPDYDMAESFRRLREGKDIQEHDIILLKHEHLEYGLMNKFGISYDEAHELTQSKYDYKTALDEFKKKNNL